MPQRRISKYRQRFHERNGQRCYYCGCRLGFSEGRNRQGMYSALAKIDHRMPLSRGGDNSPSNRVSACLFCNSNKKDMTVDEYRRMLIAKSKDGKYIWFYGELYGEQRGN